MSYVKTLESYIITDSATEGLGEKIKNSLKALVSKVKELLKKFKDWFMGIFRKNSIEVIMRSFSTKLKELSTDGQTVFIKDGDWGLAAIHNAVFPNKVALADLSGTSIIKMGPDLADTINSYVKIMSDPEMYYHGLFGNDEYQQKIIMGDPGERIKEELPQIQEIINHGYDNLTDEAINQRLDFGLSGDYRKVKISEVEENISKTISESKKVYQDIKAAATRILSAIEKMNQAMSRLESELSRNTDLTDSQRDVIIKNVSSVVTFTNQTCNFNVLSYKAFNATYVNAAKKYTQYVLKYTRKTATEDKED